jgi:hypothetical protein
MTAIRAAMVGPLCPFHAIPLPDEGADGVVRWFNRVGHDPQCSIPAKQRHRVRCQYVARTAGALADRRHAGAGQTRHRSRKVGQSRPKTARQPNC